MKQKGKKIRKNIMVDPIKLKRAKNILKAASDSKAIDMALDPFINRKTEDELWEATIEFVKHLRRDKIKPIFS